MSGYFQRLAAQVRAARPSPRPVAALDEQVNVESASFAVSPPHEPREPAESQRVILGHQLEPRALPMGDEAAAPVAAAINAAHEASLAFATSAPTPASFQAGVVAPPRGRVTELRLRSQSEPSVDAPIEREVLRDLPDAEPVNRHAGVSRDVPTAVSRPEVTRDDTRGDALTVPATVETTLPVTVETAAPVRTSSHHGKVQVRTSSGGEGVHETQAMSLPASAPAAVSPARNVEVHVGAILLEVHAPPAEAPRAAVVPPRAAPMAAAGSPPPAPPSRFSASRHYLPRS